MRPLVCNTQPILIVPSSFSLPQYNLVSESAGEIWYACSVLTALFLFGMYLYIVVWNMGADGDARTGLAVFFFFFGALPYWFKVHKHLNEVLGCWALTFPNGALPISPTTVRTIADAAPALPVGWISALRLLGDIFHLEGFYTIHLIMVVLMCATWLLLMGLTGWAFWRGEIFFAKDEDVLRDLKLLPPAAPLAPRESFESVDVEKGHGHAHGHH